VRALAITAPGQAAFIELPKPEPGPGEVLIQVRRVGYCGSDLSTFRGANPLVKLPRIPGHEVAGTVVGFGPGADNGTLQIGSDVLCLPYTSCGSCSACQARRFNCCRYNETLGVQRYGAMTEYLCLPREKVLTAPGLSLRELALVEPLTVGMHAAVRGRVARGQRVAVFGCGAIGLGAIAGAASRGASVIAIDIDDAKLEVARRSGASCTINSEQQDLHRELQHLFDDHGPHVIIEAVGNPETLRAAVDEVCWAGRVVYIGYTKTPVAYETRVFVQKELDILGSRNACFDDFGAVVALLRAKRFPVDNFVTHEVAFDEADVALKNWSEDPSAVIKVHVSLP
jgi:2-desacetyl-2-hydroxyethyl bacteriochlorophyllide A dehydrogenase